MSYFPQRAQTDTCGELEDHRACFVKCSLSAAWHHVASRLMLDTLEDRVKTKKRKLEEGIAKSTSSSEPRWRRFTGVRTTDRRPDAVSTLLLCPDHSELYGVQQLSGAVAPLEEDEKR